jgi:hypothetical protein
VATPAVSLEALLLDTLLPRLLDAKTPSGCVSWFAVMFFPSIVYHGPADTLAYPHISSLSPATLTPTFTYDAHSSNGRQVESLFARVWAAAHGQSLGFAARTASAFAQMGSSRYVTVFSGVFFHDLLSQMQTADISDMHLEQILSGRQW